MESRFKKGFTLIEVLLTVALLGISTMVIFSMLNIGQKSHAYVNDEYISQVDVRVSMQKIIRQIRTTSSMFLHQSIDDVFKDNIYDFENDITTLTVDESYMLSKGRLTDFKKAVEEKYKGWSFVVLSKDGKELRNFIYNEDDSENYFYIVERLIKSTNTIYDITLRKLTEGNTDNLVQLTLIAEDMKGKKNEMITEIEALNSLQIIDRGTTRDPAKVLFYRTDDRPMTEDISGSLTFVLDISGSMSETTMHNGTSKPKIQALKSVTDDFLNKFEDRMNLEISVVTFNESGEILVSPTNSTDTNLRSKISGLAAKGGTNTGDGIRRGYHILKDFNDKDDEHKKSNKYMLLLMDGTPTYGAVQYSTTGTIKTTTNHGEYWDNSGVNYYKYDSKWYLLWTDYYYGKVLDITEYKNSIYNGKNLRDGFVLTGTGTANNNNNISLGMAYISEMAGKLDKDNMENLKIFMIGFFTDANTTVEEQRFEDMKNLLTAHGRVVKPFNAKTGDILENTMVAISNIILDDYWHIYGPKE